MIRKIQILFYAILAFVFACVSLQCQTATVNHPLTGKYQITHMGEFSAQQLLERKATISFENFPTSAVNFGCNHMGFQTQIQSKQRVQFKDGFSTMMYCVDDVQNEMESKFGEISEKINRYEINQHKVQYYQDQTLLLSTEKIQ